MEKGTGMTTATKMVYRLDEGSAEMVALLGGKGAGVSEMARIGIPVPPGFVITTEACKEFYRLGHRFPDGLWESIVEKVKFLERETGKGFGDPRNPLVVSVRSGAPVSMPGMMDTILNMGVVDATVDGLAKLMGDERPALDAYRRLIQGFGNVVLGIEKDQFETRLDRAKKQRGLEFDYQLQPDALWDLIGQFKQVIHGATSAPMPQDPWELLRQSIEAVFTSWNNPRAITYREYQRIPHDLGTACVIMVMVFGNLGADSGTGVLFSRNPSTGERSLYGEFLANAQGEDVVAGVRTPQQLSSLSQEWPELYRQIEEKAGELERHYRDVQDVELTVERGTLYILQTRDAKRTASAAVKIAVDFVNEGVLTKEEALGRVSPDDVPQVLMPRFAPEAKQKAIEDGALLAQGLGSSPGAATGIVVMDPDRAVELASQGEKVLLVRPETSPDDVHGILRAEGVLTSRGGMTSHAAVVTRGLGKACVVGCEELEFNMAARTATARGKTIHEGDVLSVDGASGEVFMATIAVSPPAPEELSDLNTLLEWADERRTLEVWANADRPDDAQIGREYGAQGIGLCRTEHMFFDESRLPHIQKLLTVAPEASHLMREMERVRASLEEAPASERANLGRRLTEAEQGLATSTSVKEFNSSLAKLEEFQTQDFYDILKVMEGLPVVVRLLDAPLHEFLPNYADLRTEVALLLAKGDASAETREKEHTLALVESLREADPMLGHRGCRVGMTMPEVYEMQVRAIVTAACRLTKEGHTVYPEVMIPIVSHANELKWLRERLAVVAEKTRAAMGVSAEYKFGTMIEVPRAALTASEIAQEAEFFSFGTNDLTQMTFGYSRDDAEGKFLRHYVETKILPWDPFASLDTVGVGRLMRLACEEGRAAKPDLELGICGEHGGDPKSIAFCHALGLNYVSASPYRVPVARLAAAQSALGQLKSAL